MKSIAKARRMDKLKKTFIHSIKNFVYKGRIHSDIHQLRGDQGGTLTGRLSYSHPNLQQLPNYSDVGMGIRSIFLPEESVFICLSGRSGSSSILIHHLFSL